MVDYEYTDRLKLSIDVFMNDPTLHDQRYARLIEYTTIILDVPPDAEELHHTFVAFEAAAQPEES